MTPVTQEADWLQWLNTLPSWDPPAITTVVIAPHPDDETLGAGGLIAAQRRRGVEVRILAVTDGEAAYPRSPNLAEVRSAERIKAMAQLGVPESSIVRFSLPDSSVSAREGELADLIGASIPSTALVLTPWRFDPDPDHEACGRVAEKLARSCGFILLSYFFWTWHRNTVDALKDLPLCRFMLNEHLRTARETALLHYRSQLTHKRGKAILPPVTLPAARRPFETFLQHDSRP